MATKKCHHCGVTDSTHISDFGRSCLVEAVGPTDIDDLQMWLVYCRRCKHLNIFKPGWIGQLKHAFTWSDVEIKKLYPSVRKLAQVEKVAAVPKHMQIEMLNRLDAVLAEDGLL